MPELTAADVELYTGGRLLASDIETSRALARAVAAARHYCGWHVTPSRVGEVVTLHQPEGGQLLSLPTLQLTALTSVVEDGVTLNVPDLRWSVNGLVRKKSGACWCRYYRSIVVTMTHGYVTAPDFDLAVLQAVDRMTVSVGSEGAGALKRHRTDDEEEEWFPLNATSGSSSGFDASGFNSSLLNQYRILPAA